MELKFDKPSWKRAARRVREAAADAAGLALAAAQALEEKAEEAAGRARLRAEVKELEEELRLQLQAVGEMVYATHSGKPSDSEDMQEILEYIDGLHEQLAGGPCGSWRAWRATVCAARKTRRRAASAGPAAGRCKGFYRRESKTFLV